MHSASTQSPPRLLDICPSCGYSLAGSPDEGVCPECGRAYDQRVAVIYGDVDGSWGWRGWLVFAILIGVLLPLVSATPLWPIWGALFLMGMWCSEWISRNAHRPTMFTTAQRVVASEHGLFQEIVPGSTMMHLLSVAIGFIAMIAIAFSCEYPWSLSGYAIVVVIGYWIRTRPWRKRRRRQRELGRELTLSERIDLEGTPAKDVRSIEVIRDKQGRPRLEIMAIRKNKPLQPDIPIINIYPEFEDERFEFLVEQMRQWYSVPRKSSPIGAITT